MSLDASTVTAAVVPARGDAPVLQQVLLDDLRADEVLVDVAASGVCHTDLTAIDGGVPIRFPAVLGHEGAGTVVAVGERVTHVVVGDRVVLTFDACARCRRCREGHPAACVEFGDRNYRGSRPDGTSTLSSPAGDPFSGSWMAQSSWATRAVARATNVVPVGDRIPFALAAPLGCGVLTGAGTVLNVLRTTVTDRLLVVGAGAVGLSAVLAARVRGCENVTVVEPDAARRALAIDLGATLALAPEDFDPRAGSYQHLLDTVGAAAALETALAALAVGGTCATVALRHGANPVTVDQSRLLWGRTLTGVIEGDAVPSRDVPLLVRLWESGLFPLERLVTPYPFEAIDDALTDARSGFVVKAVLTMADDGEVVLPVTHGRTAAQRVLDLAAAGSGDAAELAALWDVLPAVRADDLRGLWRGTGIDTGHRIHATLARSGWYGKNFVGPDDVQPIVCRTDDGGLVADAALAGGGASLGDQEHRGKVTATMTYDTRPVRDHFVRVDDETVLGVMAGPGARDRGVPYFFLLRRVPTDPGRLAERAP